MRIGRAQQKETYAEMSDQQQQGNPVGLTKSRERFKLHVLIQKTAVAEANISTRKDDFMINSG